MGIRVKIQQAASPWPGRKLLGARDQIGMSAGAAARILELSVMRLWMLEVGEADMEEPNMWDEAIARLKQGRKTMSTPIPHSVPEPHPGADEALRELAAEHDKERENWKEIQIQHDRVEDQLRADNEALRGRLGEIRSIASTVTLKRHGCDAEALHESLCNTGDFDTIGAKEAAAMFSRIALLAASPSPTPREPEQPRREAVLNNDWFCSTICMGAARDDLRSDSCLGCGNPNVETRDAADPAPASAQGTTGPTYNHTRGDGEWAPCGDCVRAIVGGGPLAELLAILCSRLDDIESDGRERAANTELAGDVMALGDLAKAMVKRVEALETRRAEPTVTAHPFEPDAHPWSHLCGHVTKRNPNGEAAAVCGRPADDHASWLPAEPPQPAPVERHGSMLEQLAKAVKPRTTAAKFAAELKERLDKVETAFAKPGQELFCSAIAYAKGVIDTALGDFDVREPEDLLRGQPLSAAIHGEPAVPELVKHPFVCDSPYAHRDGHDGGHCICITCGHSRGACHEDVTAEHVAQAHALASRCPAGAGDSPARYHQPSCLRIARALAAADVRGVTIALFHTAAARALLYETRSDAVSFKLRGEILAGEAIAAEIRRRSR